MSRSEADEGGAAGGGDGRKRARDTVSTLAFMSSKTRFDERRDAFADARLDDESSSKLATFVKRFRRGRSGEQKTSSAAADRSSSSRSAFSSDMERILQISDDHVEQLMLPGAFASASELTRAAFRVAGTGMNLAIVSAAPCEDQKCAVKALAESAAALGISCLVLHATRASFLASPIRESTEEEEEEEGGGSSLRQNVISYVFGLGGWADTYPPDMAARIIRSRFPRELSPLFRVDQRPMIIIDDVFSLSRAALARVEALVSALVSSSSSSSSGSKKSWTAPSAGWGGAQVIVSGCPIRSAAPVQLRKTDDLDFLPCTIEWERWFPVMIEVPAEFAGEGRVASSLQLLLSEDPDSSKAREHRERISGGLSICHVAGPTYLSGFPGVTIVAFQGLADAKMRKQMENLRSRGFAVLALGTRMTLKIKDADSWTTIPSPTSDPERYDAEAARVGFRTRPVPDFLRKSREESTASSVVRPEHFEVHEHVRQVIKYNVPQACEGVVNEFAEGVAVAFTHPPERRGQVGVVESVSPSLTDRRVVVRMVRPREEEEEEELVSVQEEAFDFEIVIMKRKFCLNVCCMPIIPITYVPLELAAHLDMRGVRRKMNMSLDPFLMEKSPVSPLVALLSEGRIAFHKNPGEAIFGFKDDLATAARYLALCKKTARNSKFSREHGGIRFRSSSKTRYEFLLKSE